MCGITSSKYRHIFFDLDHTLWDFERNSRSALEQIHAVSIAPVHSQLKFKDFYYRYVDVNANWWQQYRMGKAHKADLRIGRFRDTLQRFGIEDEELSEELAASYVKISPYQTALFPTTIDTLSALQERGHEMHIITNGFEEVQHIKLRESGLSRFFKEVITSEQVSARKPDIRIFEHALALSGAKAADSLMVGDSLDADIRGAADIGMAQVYFNPKGLKHNAKPTYEVERLSELLRIV